MPYCIQTTGVYSLDQNEASHDETSHTSVEGADLLQAVQLFLEIRGRRSVAVSRLSWAMRRLVGASPGMKAPNDLSR